MFSLIETFIEVYNLKSFTKAALILHVTQSAVTKRIKKLEEELKVKLFEKHTSHKIQVTEAANTFYPVALRLFNDLESIKLKLENDFSGLPLSIGCSPEFSYFITPQFYQLLSSDEEDFILKVQIHSTNEILRKLKENKLNFGLIETDLMTIQDEFELLKFKLLCEEPLALVGNIDSKKIFFKDNEGQLSPTLKKFFRENSYDFKRKIFINDINMTIKYLNSGIGTSLLPKQCIPEGMPSQELGKDYTRKYWIVYREKEVSFDFLNKIITYFSKTG